MPIRVQRVPATHGVSPSHTWKAWITVLAYWGVGFTCGWWLGKHEGQGPVGLWKGLVAGLAAAALLLLARFVLRARHFLRHGVPERALDAPPPV